MRTTRALGIGLLVTLVTGCSSSGQASGQNDDASTACTATSVSFQNDIMPIFAASCTLSTVCHGQVGNSGEENLYLGPNATGGTQAASQSADVYRGLVGVPSLEDPSMKLVSAGDLQKSYLWHKINGDPNSDTATATGCTTVASGPNACSDCSTSLSTPCGAQMPIGSVLDSSTICAIRSWIAGGAMQN